MGKGATFEHSCCPLSGEFHRAVYWVLNLRSRMACNYYVRVTFAHSTTHDNFIVFHDHFVD